MYASVWAGEVWQALWVFIQHPPSFLLANKVLGIGHVDFSRLLKNVTALRPHDSLSWECEKNILKVGVVWVYGMNS